MPAPSSAPDSAKLGMAAWPVKTRLLMLALNSLPLWHVVLTIVSAKMMGAHGGMWLGIGAGLAMLYLLPPLATRILDFFCPIVRNTSYRFAGVSALVGGVADADDFLPSARAGGVLAAGAGDLFVMAAFMGRENWTPHFLVCRFAYSRSLTATHRG